MRYLASIYSVEYVLHVMMLRMMVMHLTRIKRC
jgi:hypothetical protein